MRRSREDDLPGRWLAVLLYNLFAAIWLMALLAGWGLWTAVHGNYVPDVDSRDAATFFGCFVGLVLGGLLLAVQRRIPRWFRRVLIGALIVYLVLFGALLYSLQQQRDPVLVAGRLGGLWSRFVSRDTRRIGESTNR